MNDDSLVNQKAVSVLFCPLTITSRSNLSAFLWLEVAEHPPGLPPGKCRRQALSVSGQGLGTLFSAPGCGVGTAELSWRCLCAPQQGGWWLGSSHFRSVMRVALWSSLKDEHGQRQGEAAAPWSWVGSSKSSEVLPQGRWLKKKTKKWGVLWTQGGTLDFLNSVPCQWRKTGFSRAPSSGSYIKPGSGALLLHVVLAEGGPCEHLQSIWHGEQLDCTK